MRSRRSAWAAEASKEARQWYAADAADQQWWLLMLYRCALLSPPLPSRCEASIARALRDGDDGRLAQRVLHCIPHEIEACVRLGPHDGDSVIEDSFGVEWHDQRDRAGGRWWCQPAGAQCMELLQSVRRVAASIPRLCECHAIYGIIL